MRSISCTVSNSVTNVERLLYTLRAVSKWKRGAHVRLLRYMKLTILIRRGLIKRHANKPIKMSRIE